MSVSFADWRFRAYVLLLVLAVCPGCRPARTNPQPTSQPAVRRIITLAPDAAEIIAALGQSKRIVAVSDFCVYPPELRSLPRIGGLFNPDLEAIVQLRPDLLVLRGGSETLERLCADRHIRIFRDRTEGFEDIYTTIGELGRMLDCPEAAVALQSEMRRRMEDIVAAVAGRPRPRVFLAVAREPGSLANILTASEGTFVHEIITLAGGQNVFAHLAMDYPQVSPEAILVARPEVIIEAMPEAEPSPELERSVRLLWGRLGPMPATQAGRVYVLTDDNALIPSPRVVEVVARLAGWLHPEAWRD